jgi:hypothetical protein
MGEIEVDQEKMLNARIALIVDRIPHTYNTNEG